MIFFIQDRPIDRFELSFILIVTLYPFREILDSCGKNLHDLFFKSDQVFENRIFQEGIAAVVIYLMNVIAGFKIDYPAPQLCPQTVAVDCQFRDDPDPLLRIKPQRTFKKTLYP